MSNYQVLARKYRPKTFETLVGQDHIATALSNAIDSGRLHHAYLFTGTRGVGKTTIARILAKCLNCETGVTSTPCGQCEACVAVDEGRFLDLIEIDAASRTKVEDTRELLDNVPYAPVQGRYKVYLIDEVHMLSNHSFNALLKTLEEPPEHAKFLFATTDPQKLPITIVSRCLQFVLRPLPQALLASHLATILDAEKIPFAKAALWQIAQSAKGSVRDALSLTDQAIAFGGGQIELDTVSQMLGLIDSVDVLSLVADIHQDNRQAVATRIERMRERMMDASAILELLIERIHQLAMVQILPELSLDLNDTDAAALKQLSQVMRAETLQLYYEILIKSKEGLRFANTPMQGLEMAILRLLAFKPLQASAYVVTEQPDLIESLPSVHQAQTQAQAEEAEPLSDWQPQVSHEPVLLSLKGSDGDDNEPKKPSSLQNEYSKEPSDFVDSDVTDANIQPSQAQDFNAFEPLTTPSISADEAIPSKQVLGKASENNKTKEVSSNIVTEHTVHPASESTPIQEGLSLKQMLDAPRCELVGSWTPQKWDYWSHQAYRLGKLSADEFALAKDSLIEGMIGGEAVLRTPQVHYQIELSFEHLKDKLYQDLGVSLRLDETDIDASLTPQVQHDTRMIKVREKAYTALLTSSVIETLEQSGYLLEGEALNQLRLEFL